MSMYLKNNFKIYQKEEYIHYISVTHPSKLNVNGGSSELGLLDEGPANMWPTALRTLSRERSRFGQSSPVTYAWHPDLLGQGGVVNINNFHLFTCLFFHGALKLSDVQ